MDFTDFEFEPELARAGTIPSRWYTEPAVLAAERSAIFGRTWQAAGLAAWVGQAGSYFGCEIAGEPVMVTRAADGVLRAFSNVCRHRGAELCGAASKGATVKCPYHGWTYALDGNLRGAPEFEGVANWERAAVRLPEFRAEAWGPYIFVNLDQNAPPLAEIMGAIPAEVAKMGCPIGSLRHSYRRDYVIECNWKVYVDNYLEGYHLPSAHPSLFRELDYAKYRVDTFRHYSSQIAPIRAAGADEARRYEFGDDTNQALYYWIFPNLMLNVYPDNLSANLVVPLSAEKTLTIFEWFGYGDAEVEESTIEFSDEIQQEDIRICESVQRGLRSQYYDRGRFSVKRENGVHHFHGLLAAYLK